MTISSGSQTNWFLGVDNLDQSWYTTLANSVTAVGTNVGDLMYDGGSVAAYPAGQQASQSSEAADQALFAQSFLGCATEGVLSTETNKFRRINIRTEGVKFFNCPSQTFKIGDLVGIYSDGANPPDPQQVDAAQAPASAIGIVVPVPGNPDFYDSAVTQVLVRFQGRKGTGLALETSRTPAQQFVTISAANGTLAAGNMEGAGDCVLATSGATAMTTRTAAQLFAAVPGVSIGFKYRLRVFNSNAGTLTLTGGTGVTITGTATIATNVWREYIVTFTSATAVTMQNVGAGNAT